MNVAASFLATAGAARPLLASDAVARRWDDASALPDYSVAGLAAHLARAVLTVDGYLSSASPDVPATSDAVGYFLAVLADHDPVDSAFHRSVRARATAAAAAGRDGLLDAFTAAQRSLTDALDRVSPDDTVTVLDGVTISVDEYLRTRLVELVVHVDDLSVSVDAEPVALPDAAHEEVAAVLARLAVRRHGGLAVVRSLARRERHPDPVRAL
ncbi:maleylpyruvate isomerase N-terminal domain-containing protein [Egicoccus halophilus]|uniref:Mycothiol-dependent maleylpyruvate isomerase metal-binding domain-containing protein n=1 Tax=Egicoccus halophilus TaxID=1670830 RepID=A0A8J3AAU0_9ACTN|nr:maleylpyruvate isomerase N-terminal domain-containing protein [Egicoccus halophilus]GGI08903.1 hypothetical protein GCM10011354_31410 [Egicoccus halophilus]